MDSIKVLMFQGSPGRKSKLLKKNCCIFFLVEMFVNFFSEVASVLSNLIKEKHLPVMYSHFTDFCICVLVKRRYEKLGQ